VRASDPGRLKSQARDGVWRKRRDRPHVRNAPCSPRSGHRVSRDPCRSARARGSPKNRTCGFLRIRLKPLERPLSHDPAKAMFLLDLRDTRMQPPYPSRAESAPGALRIPPFAFSLSDGSSCFLATRHPSDVGSLSRPVMLQPVSAPLQHGLRFFRHLKPAHRSVRLTARPLASAFASMRDIRGFHVPQLKLCEVRYPLSTDKFNVHETATLTPRSDLRCHFG